MNSEEKHLLLIILVTVIAIPTMFFNPPYAADLSEIEDQEYVGVDYKQSDYSLEFDAEKTNESTYLNLRFSDIPDDESIVVFRDLFPRFLNYDVSNENREVEIPYSSGAYYDEIYVADENRFTHDLVQYKLDMTCDGSCEVDIEEETRYVHYKLTEITTGDYGYLNSTSGRLSLESEPDQAGDSDE